MLEGQLRRVALRKCKNAKGSAETSLAQLCRAVPHTTGVWIHCAILASNHQVGPDIVAKISLAEAGLPL